MSSYKEIFIRCFKKVITSRISSGGTCNRIGAVCVLLVGPTLCTTSTVQSYIVYHRSALCIINLCCAPWCTRGPRCVWALLRPNRLTYDLDFCMCVYVSIHRNKGTFGQKDCMNAQVFSLYLMTCVDKFLVYVFHVYVKANRKLILSKLTLPYTQGTLPYLIGLWRKTGGHMIVQHCAAQCRTN